MHLHGALILTVKFCFKLHTTVLHLPEATTAFFNRLFLLFFNGKFQMDSAALSDDYYQIKTETQNC